MRRPALVRPGHAWSRSEVLDWLIEAAAEAPTLFGFDFSFAPPIVERGEYLPGEAGVPAEAKSLLGLCRRAERRRGSRRGELPRARASPPFLFRRGRRDEARLPPSPRLRACVQRHRRRQGLDPLRRDRRRPRSPRRASPACGCSIALDGRVPVWPMDALPERGQPGRRNLHARLHPPRRAAAGARCGAGAAQRGARRVRLSSRADFDARAATITRPTC